MKYQRSAIVGLLWIGLLLCVAGVAQAQFAVPPNYPPVRPDPNDGPVWTTLGNNYIACNVGIQGNILANAVFSDDQDGNGKWGRGDKVRDVNDHNWHVSGRWGVVTVHGDPEKLEDDNRPITFMGSYPCHYFGYWKLKIGNDMRMVGDGATGQWYSTGAGQPVYSPTRYDVPPPDLLTKEKTLGTTGPFIRGIWNTTGGSGSTIRTEIRMHLVRDMVRFEYRITNMGTAIENVGFSQNGDVEVGDPAPIPINGDVGGYYGPYSNQNYAFVTGNGAAQPVAKQHSMMYGGTDPVDGTLNPVVPDSFEVYDDVQAPINVTRNVLGLEDAVKPDVVAIGEYNDLFHKDMWVPLDYKPDKLHNILDMCWVLCWAQKPLAPGATRTIVTYYGIGAATSRWTYLVGKNPTRDQAVLAVQAIRSVKYDSTTSVPELNPTSFSVKAYVYNLATDPGPYDLRDATASIYLPKGLELAPGVADNDATKPLDGIVGLNSESTPVEWTVRATGDYAGELPIYVSVVDNDPSGRHWQQSVTRKVYVPATKRGQFQYGWQLMHVPFAFNNPTINYVFGLVPGRYSAKYYDSNARVYKPVEDPATGHHMNPGQAFWMFVEGPTWGHPQPFFLQSDAAIVGEALGTGKQAMEQHLPLASGWNMVGNPFVYPVYWGQVLVYSGGETKTLDDAYRARWIDKTLFSWNTDKWDYDISSDSSTLLNPWKGYWVNTYRPLTLVIRPPLFPEADVTANPGGN